VTYSLTFGRNSQLIWAIILPGIILLVPLMIILSYLLPLVPDNEWNPIIIAFVYFGLVFWVTFKWVKATTAKVEIAINNGVIEFVFPKKNIFHRHNFNLTFPEIRNLSEDNDKGFDFLYFETTHPVYNKFHITAAENNTQLAEFKEKVFEMEAAYKADPSSGVIITHKTIYQKWPMKIATLFIVMILFAYPIVSYYKQMNWLVEVRYWVLLALSFPLVTKVYNQNFGKK
jgi:hypothetical protein